MQQARVLVSEAALCPVNVNLRKRRINVQCGRFFSPSLRHCLFRGQRIGATAPSPVQPTPGDFSPSHVHLGIFTGPYQARIMPVFA